jgi:hypothetical protein
LTATFCRACKGWFDKADGVCPCGKRRSAFNAALVSQRWATALNEKAAAAAREG